MEKVRIQDDLYNYVNGEWLENAVIPDDKPTVGGFSDLATDVEKKMIDDLNKMSNEVVDDIYLERALNLYNAILNVKKRNRDSIKPLLKALKKIEAISDIKKLNKEMKNLVVDGYPLPFNMSVEVDMKNAEKHSIIITGPSAILPDVSYYKEEMKAQKEALLSLYKNMALMILKNTNLSEEDQALYVDDCLKFDELISKYVKSNEEWSEYAKIYNPMKLSKINSLLKPLKFKKMILDVFNTDVDYIVVGEPRYFKAFNEVFNEKTFILYKHWAYVMTSVDTCPYLTEELRNIGGIYKRALSGVKEMMSTEKYAYNLTTNIYSEPIGLYYGKKYFGEEAKKDVVDMVMNIIETYKKRVRNSDILLDSTKEKAVLKLSTMKVKMGYPDKVSKIYDILDTDFSKSLYEIVFNLQKIKRVDNFNKLTKDVDRNEWVMAGNVVNACYNPFSNDITFPAAILQAPFYSIKQTRSQNLGGIGAVIGHEISHAFDNNGALFDEKGNLNNWWTKEDFKKFKIRTQAMIKQFDGIELPWGKVNGSFIVSENIADNGGVAVTLDVMSQMKEKDYTEYFTNWAKVWCMKAKEEYLKLLLACDVHGPKELRANMPPRNFDEWYLTFNVKKTDKMYIAPNKRVVIW